MGIGHNTKMVLHIKTKNNEGYAKLLNNDRY